MPYRPWDTPAVLSQVKRVMFYIAYHPWQSASQIARELNLKRAVVSGALKKLSEGGHLVRKPGCGPRGGMGYWLADPPPREPSPTWYERLLREADTPEP